MNIIQKHTLETLGYNFVESKFLPKGKDEYWLRNQQNKKHSSYRKLTALEIEVLVRNGNTSDDWNKILVSKSFNPEQVKNCQFYGLVRIGSMEPVYQEFHDFKMPVGIYNSTVISCDIGDNVCIDNVNYLSHYIIGNDVMIANVNELTTTNHAKFGNGILKEGEEEKVRVWMELCNENGGRGVIPFNGMLPGDAYMWSKYRDDAALLDKFKELTEKKFDKYRGWYGVIGDRTVLKNCKIIKDVNVGTDAYFKGANKLKNLTVNSDEKRKSQIGEGCELVNGIVGYGCRIFYGAKAVRFVMSSHSQLKYGARLLNSYLGNNSTISCCEVLNSLIFPAHEQHHNNSFLCAAMVMGQSNMAAGATIGSNHNSRSADGEIVAGRGFWPGLCVSLKHNSKFASFTIIAKGDFPAELNIPIPFCLVSNDVTNDKLVVMPAYWFMYNMYALARNAWKYIDRDRRTEKIQAIEFNYLAPDTVNEIFNAIDLLNKLTVGKNGVATVKGWENSNRTTELIKVPQAKKLFRELIQYYAVNEIWQHCRQYKPGSFDELKKTLSAKISRSQWINVGGQLIQKEELEKLKRNIKADKIKSWDDVHDFYRKQGALYPQDKLNHAYTSLLEILNITPKQFTPALLKKLLLEMQDTQQWMCNGIYNSRAKDYTNPFRKMIYETNEEMNKVVGRLEDNTFIQQQAAELDTMKKQIKAFSKKWKL
jgi:NDP-sugar pyrophosphorylase family protein